MVKRGEIYCPRPRNATIFDLHITSFYLPNQSTSFLSLNLFSRNLSFQNMKYIKVLNVEKFIPLFYLIELSDLI